MDPMSGVVANSLTRDGMLKYVQEKYYQKRGLIFFFILTYLDKAISFAVPLSVLLILNDQSLYTEIEVILSYATIISVVVELGFSNYLFYGYRESNDKDKFITKARIFFAASTFGYFLINSVLILYLHLTGSNFLPLFIFVSFRTQFVFFLNFYSNIYRLVDTPSKVYIANVILNVSSFLLVMLANQLGTGNELLYFFLPSILLIFVVSAKFLIKIRLFIFGEYVKYVKDALTFSWPIILNVLAMSFMNNYAKIYAYGHLTQQEMVRISYTLRLSLIIFLSHTAFTSYFAKSIFMDPARRFNYSIFKQYSLVLFLSVFLVGMAVIVSNELFGDEVYIPLDPITFLFLTYTLMWCYMGYLELYFGIMNANRNVLVYSVTSSVVYVSLLRGFSEIGLQQLAMFMALAGALNLILFIIGLYRLGLFSKRS